MSRDATELHIGKRLYAAGWRQGAILRSSTFKTAHNNRLSSDGLAEMKLRQVKERESLVVVSQDCDILSGAEPYVEAFVCSVERADFCANIVNGNSSRWFLIDRDAHLVAHATRRTVIKKELLETLTPENWPANEDHLDRFARWLARRYIRPAYPDEFNEAVQDPVREVLEGTNEAVVTHFSNIVHEMRIHKFSIQGPPFKVSLALLVLRRDITNEEADAIDQITREIENRYASDPRIDSSTFAVRTLDQMSAAEYLASNPIYLDYYTHGGDEYTGGAEALPQA